MDVSAEAYPTIFTLTAYCMRCETSDLISEHAQKSKVLLVNSAVEKSHPSFRTLPKSASHSKPARRKRTSARHLHKSDSDRGHLAGPDSDCGAIVCRQANETPLS
jgi:hypothetical protein